MELQDAAGLRNRNHLWFPELELQLPGLQGLRG